MFTPLGHLLDTGNLSLFQLRHWRLTLLVAAGFSATTWSLGSSNVASDLSAGQEIAGVLIESIIAGIVAFLCGEPGVCPPLPLSTIRL